MLIKFKKNNAFRIAFAILSTSSYVSSFRRRLVKYSLQKNLENVWLKVVQKRERNTTKHLMLMLT